jgi:hypothetical protein
LSDTSQHTCLRVSDEAAVRAFLAAAIAGGCANDGEPGQRQGAMTGYCGAFIRDGEGNKIQASRSVGGARLGWRPLRSSSRFRPWR